MRWNILIGGPAGTGPNFIANLLSRALMEKGFSVFSCREYESRIKGGHNFNIVSFSDEEIFSHSDEIDLLIELDDVTEKIHSKQLKKKSFVVKGRTNNVYEVAQAFKILGIEFSVLEKELKSSPHYEENIKEAREGYSAESRSLILPKLKAQKKYIMTGAEGTAIGAIKSDLGFYYAYPMTPATSLLFELVARESDNKFKTVELESEISNVNAAIGSAITGAKSMVGTSGGGFDLMTETLSMSAMAEIPLVFYLVQRTGPGTGAATYQSQGDLLMALNAGHGEFIRIVAAPGDPLECIEKTSEIFYLTQKYRMPGIILSDRHLAESLYTHSKDAKISKSVNGLKWPGRFSSYITNDEISSTGEAKFIKRSFEKRIKKESFLSKEIESLESYKIHGNKSSKNIVVGWGSTKGAIIDALKELDFKFLQIIYLQPFSKMIEKELKKASKIVVIENNANSQLSQVIAQNTGILIDDKKKILKYDGRPFTNTEVVIQLRRLLNEK